MKAHLLPLMYVGAFSLGIAACAPDATPSGTVVKKTPADVQSYAYLCEEGYPEYESYCSDFGSLSTYIPLSISNAPCELTYSHAQCLVLLAAINRLQGSGNASCKMLGDIAAHDFDPGSPVGSQFSPKGGDTAGVAYPNADGNMWGVTNRFFTSLMAADQAGVVAHELSHLYFGTNDSAQGTPNSAYNYDVLCHNGGKPYPIPPAHYYADAYNDGNYDDYDPLVDAFEPDQPGVVYGDDGSTYAYGEDDDYHDGLAMRSFDGSKMIVLTLAPARHRVVLTNPLIAILKNDPDFLNRLIRDGHNPHANH